MWPVIVQLLRTADAIIHAVIAVEHGAARPDPDRVADLRQAIRELDAEASGRPGSDGVEVTSEGVLAPIRQELDTTRAMLREAAQSPTRGRIDLSRLRKSTVSDSPNKR
jgi:hypothetical protein